MSNASDNQKLDRLLQHAKKQGDVLEAIRSNTTDLPKSPPPQTAQTPLPYKAGVRNPVVQWIKRPIRFVRRSGAIGFLLGLFGALSAYTALRYDVSVTPLAPMSSQKQLDIRFVIENTGPFSIYNVYYGCNYRRVVSGHISGQGFIGMVPVPLKQLGAHSSYSIRCQDTLVGDANDKDWVLIVSAFYTPKFIPWSTRISDRVFLFTKTDDGHVVWLPLGINPMDKKEMEQTSIEE